MSDLLSVGAFIGGIWAFSLLGLKAIRDSHHADEHLQDAAAAAIIGVNFVSAAASAFVLGVSAFDTYGSGIFAVFIYLIPFVAMVCAHKPTKKWHKVLTVVAYVVLVSVLGIGIGSEWWVLGNAVLPQ